MTTLRVGSATALRVVARPLLYLQYLKMRQIMRAGAFPPNAGGGTIPGPDPERLVVVGEATSIGYGTLLSELSIAGHLARQRAVRSQRGVEWSTAPFPDLTVHTAHTVVSQRSLFMNADIVVVMLGIGDAVRVTPARTWARLLGSALDELRAHVPERGAIVVAETPPLDLYPDLPRALKTLAGRQARQFNDITRELVRDRPGCLSVAFPPERLTDLRRPDSARASSVYSTWAAALLSAIAPD